MNFPFQLAAPAAPRRTSAEPFRGQARRRLLRADLLVVIAWASAAVAACYGMAEGLDPVRELVALWTQVPNMWLAICIGTGAAVAYYRVLEPLVATFRHQLSVSRVAPVAPGVVSIELTGRHLDELAGRGVRFFIWRFLSPGAWWHPHPFSLFAEPAWSGSSGHGTLRITVRNLGPGHSAAVTPESRDAGARRGAVRAFQHGGAQPAPDRVDGSRHRHHPTPRPAGAHSLRTGPCNGAAPRAHRGGPYLGDEILDLCRSRGAALFHLTGPRRATPLRKVRLVRKRAALSAALASAGILLAGWQSGEHVADTGSSAAATSSGTAESSGTTNGSAATRSAGSASSGGAAPLLRAAVLKAQSAPVRTISGATVTSDAYLTSLQAAIDAANL